MPPRLQVSDADRKPTHTAVAGEDARRCGAWLDRPGRTLAIVWEQKSTPADRATAVTGISNEHEVSLVEIDGKDVAAVAQSFRAGTGWLRGADVDRLSEEEAGVIANRLLARVAKSLPASSARVRHSNRRSRTPFAGSWSRRPVVRERNGATRC